MSDAIRNSKIKDETYVDAENNRILTMMKTSSDCIENGNRIMSPKQRTRLRRRTMDKKSRSNPMSETLSRLDENLFETAFFGDEMLLNDPVPSCPIVDVTMSFCSSGCPLSKSKEWTGG